MSQREAFKSPYDTPVSGATRFGVEVIAWVAGPWAAANVALWLAAPVAVVLLVLPAVFSTRGDKRQVVVATPGPARVVIEVLLLAVAAAAPWAVWPLWLAIACDVVVAVAIVSGVRRTRWLLRGAQVA